MPLAVGFAVDDIRRSIVAVRGEESLDDAERAVELFARAAWSMIAEPGDGTAAILVRALGPRTALEAVIDRLGPQELAARIEPNSEVVRAQLAGILADGLARWRPRMRSAALLQALTLATLARARLVVPGDEEWPRGVDDLDGHPPLALWVRGQIGRLAGLERSLAIVGARASTEYGVAVAIDSAAGVAAKGIAVVSGAAYGIDGAAHRGALAASGLTIAFLAGGVDRFYPSGHRDLLARIVEDGIVVSEMVCGSSPTRWRFLQRNRLIAAAATATVVVEAGWHSGSLNTAGHAATLGRPLGAVPGPVSSAASVGAHRVLREYAGICVTGADDMAELVDGFESRAAEQTAPTRRSEELRVLDALSSRTARSVDDIARLSGLSAATAAGTLAMLELDGEATAASGGWTRRTRR